MPKDELSPDFAIRQVPAVDLPHPRTEDIDFLSSDQLATLLLSIQQEIFDGAPTGELGLSSAEAARTAETLGREMAAVWTETPQQSVLLAGGQMTGRLAAYLALRFNAALRVRGLPACFVAEMAGGPSAFFNPFESIELDAEAGADRWYALKEQVSIALTIGLTDDLSTPYVCSLLDGALGEAKGRVILVGFVSPEQARSSRVLADGRSARDFIRALERMPQGLLLSIPVGPEPIQEATRSKCGSATLALLMAAFLYGLEGRPVAATWQALREANAQLGVQEDTLSELIDIDGEVLKKVGSIFYMGKSGAGLMGVIDAAECVSTFAQNPKRMRGFCLDGSACGLESLPVFGSTTALRPTLRSQVSEDALRHILSETQVAPRLVVAVDVENKRNLALNELLRMAVHAGGYARRVSIPVTAEAGAWLMEWSWEFAVRTLLNCFSTAVHVLSGKTYSSQMIDIRMNSLGLFQEAVNIVSDLGAVGASEAKQALITVIYRGDTDSHVPDDLASHLAAAAGRSGLVARALLLVRGVSLEEALTLQSHEPIVRKTLATVRDVKKSDT